MTSEHTKILLQELKYIHGFQFRYLDTPLVWERNRKQRITQHERNTGRTKVMTDHRQRHRG